MVNEPNEPQDLPNILDDTLLDRAMAQAFEASNGNDESSDAPISVLQRIEQRHGAQTRIALRDADAEGEGQDTLVLPSRKDEASGAKLLGDRYQVFGEIARGGMGTILKGRDADLGREVAIKVLQPKFAKQPQMVQRFVEEAQITGQLQHPGILPVYELGLQDDARPYFSMKLIKGRTLAHLLEERQGAETDRAKFLKIFEQICQAIAYAQARGVIHRDLKPANVMVGAFGEVQVVDWGLAKVLGQGTDDDGFVGAATGTRIETVRTEKPGSASMVGAVMGTPGYMAPEQAKGEVREIDERTDVYALGGMLFEILTGSPPVDRMNEKSSEEFDVQPLEMKEIKAQLHLGTVDDELIELTCSCLALRRRDRLRNAKVIADALNKYLASLETRAHEAEVRSAEEQARAESERHRRRLTIALASIIVIATLGLALGGGMTYAGVKKRAETNTSNLALAISTTGGQLGVARAARIDNDEVWEALDAAGLRVEALLELVPLDSELAVQALALLDEIEVRSRRRKLGATIENVVIYGATHYDSDSWQEMERNIVAVLLEFDIDLDTMEPDEVARRIREHEATAELSDALELWLGTIGSLVEMGATTMEYPEFLKWVGGIIDSDPDPIRVKIRRFLYAALTGEAVLREDLDEMMESLDYDTVPPRTLSWLGTVYFILDDEQASIDIFRHITDAHPDDFMASFDAAFQCENFERWELAIRYYWRCLTIRGDVAGLWRQLGVAYRHTSELNASLEALTRSIWLDPDHGPTYVDRAATQLAMDDLEACIIDAKLGMELSDASDAPAHFVIGQAQFAVEQYTEALHSFELAKEAGESIQRFKEPVDEWIERCRAMLDETNPDGD